VGWSAVIAKAGWTAPVSETLVRVLLSTMQLACNKCADLHESNRELRYMPDIGIWATLRETPD
jgi:hypothetical protein